MTPRQYLGVLLRRWYVLVLVAVLTVAGLALVRQVSGVYSSRATVVFIPPVNPKRAGNVLEGSDPSLIYFAAAVERQVNGGQQQARVAGDAPLYGVGISDGWSVALVNSGGQWQTNFNRPMLSIEVVAPTAAEADDRMSALIAAVTDTARGMQSDGGAAPESMIDLEVSPDPPSVIYVSGNQKRAMAAVVLIGAMVALIGSLLVDRWALRRRAARDESADSSPEHHVETDPVLS